MTIMGLAVLLCLLLTILGLVVWASDEYARVKAGDKWPEDWHELIK